MQQDEVDGNVVRIEVRNAYRILVGKPEGRRPLVRCMHTWRIILQRILVKVWTRIISGKELVAGFSEYGNKPSGYIKGEGGFISQQSDY
jgi:hypothetical protein